MKKLFRRDPILLGVFCALLAYLPFRLFDRVDVIWLVAVELLVLGIGMFVVRPYRRHLVIALMMLIGFLAVGEIYLRLSAFGLDGLSVSKYIPAAYGNPYCSLELDDSTYTGIKGGQEVMFNTRPFRVNERGFRGDAAIVPKPANVYRIVIVGASATLGSGVYENERFSSLLEADLNDGSLPFKVEVVNLSVPGTHIGHRIHTIEEEGLRLEPDLIMIQMNEAKRSTKSLIIKPRKAKTYDVGLFEQINSCRYEVFRSNFFFARILLAARRGKMEFGGGMPEWTWLAKLLADGTNGETDGMLTEEREKELTQRYAPMLEGLQILKDDCRGCGMVLYRLKPVSCPVASSADRLYGQFLSRQAAALDMHVVDTYDIDFGRRSVEDLIVYPGDSHPNTIVHRLYADSMVPQIRNIILGNQAQNQVP